ncbi:MAG: hypothetical protein WD042_05350 [Phycisphaeraceae bacterium]
MATLTIQADGRTPKPVTEDHAMPAIVEFPTIVTEALAQFGDLFANEPERRHFAEFWLCTLL